MLDTNRTKICFWHRITCGLYEIGDIIVEKHYHTTGTCAGSDMWHVKIENQTVVSWAYLKDAKKSAHLINRAVTG